MKNPSEYGIVEFDKNQNPIKLIEKPKNPKSKFAITGMYFYDKNSIKYAKNLDLQKEMSWK